MTPTWDAAAVVLVLGVIFKFALDWQVKKREAEAAKASLQVLRDIAISNQAIREGQIAQNGKLSAVVKVNDEHHNELIRAITASCKARPIFPIEEDKKQP